MPQVGCVMIWAGLLWPGNLSFYPSGRGGDGDHEGGGCISNVSGLEKILMN